MGYDVHITRKPNWFDNHGPRISLEEWLDFVATDPEMRLEGYAEPSAEDAQVLRIESDGLSVWTSYSAHGDDGNMAWFEFGDGCIDVKSPDPEILRKMWTIAQTLSAKVQGDDGEFYDATGNAISETTSIPQLESTNKPWWKRWQDRFRR